MHLRKKIYFSTIKIRFYDTGEEYYQEAIRDKTHPLNSIIMLKLNNP